MSRDVVLLLAFAVLIWAAAHVSARPGGRPEKGREGAGRKED